MFSLSQGDLEGVVLDCAGGASSFTAELGAAGGRGLAVDPVYAEAADLAERIAEDGVHLDAMRREARESFTWDWYGSPETFLDVRAAAAERFLNDVQERPGCYLAGGLPRLPLRDGSVDLVLSSHLLFTWADPFDEAWHRAALLEMARVARREVRVYPLVRRGRGDPIEFLDSLLHDLNEPATSAPDGQDDGTGLGGPGGVGLRAELRRVQYEFQRGATHMLVVQSSSSPS
jgi:hypothetical protein